MTEDITAGTTSFLDLAGSKLRARLGSQVNEAASAGVTNKFARRHLEKLGWEEGTGLGKRRSGITTHIKVQRRSDEQGGLGKSTVDENLQIGSEWWKSTTGNVLAKLAEKSKKKKKDKKEKKTFFTDEELFEATGGARFGMRQGTRQEGKWKRTEKSKELKELEEEAKQKVEWDGTTAPKVILSLEKKKEEKKEKKKEEKKEKKKRERELEKTIDAEATESKEERRARKKRKKEMKKEKKQSSS